MKRREVSRLCASAAAAVVAGCTGTPSPDDEGDNETYVRKRDREEDEPELDADDFDIGGVSLNDPDDFSDRPYITGDVINEGEAESGLIRVRATFYDADGEVVDDAHAELRDLQPGEPAGFAIELPTDLSRADFEEYELDVRVLS